MFLSVSVAALLLRAGSIRADAPTTAPTERITVERVLPSVKRITFDPARPPPDMPRLKGRVSALTQYEFNCAVDLKYEIVSSEVLPTSMPADDAAPPRVRVIAAVRALKLRLTLENRIYLPLNANLPLRAHEEGHREINERVYERYGRPAAESIAQRYLNTTVTAEAADEDSAGKMATDRVVRAIGREYLTEVADVASRLGDEYDEITQHGRRPVKVARAIELAWHKELARASTRASATTRSATTLPAVGPAGVPAVGSVGAEATEKADSSTEPRR